MTLKKQLKKYIKFLFPKKYYKIKKIKGLFRVKKMYTI